MRIGVAGPFLTSPFHRELGIAPGARVPPGLGGTPVVSLVQGFLARGDQVTVFTLDPAVSREVVLRGDQLTVCIGPYRSLHRARDIFRVERGYLRAAMQRERPDVIHAHWTYEFALAALDSGIPALVTAHDAPFRILGLSPDPYRAVRTMMAWRVSRKAEHMTAVSLHVRRHFRNWLRYRGSMTVVANAVPETILELGRTRVPRSARSFAAATVLTGWSRVKNGETALRAFALARKAIPEAELLMFGPGYGPGEQAEVWAKRRRLDAGVQFMGAVPQERLAERLSADIDVLIHPSREEASPMAVAEAMAVGLPVIGGIASGGVPEILDCGASGVLVDIEAPDEIAAALVRLAGDRDRRLALGRQARESAEHRFTPFAVAGAYHSILETLA